MASIFSEKSGRPQSVVSEGYATRRREPATIRLAFVVGGSIMSEAAFEREVAVGVIPEPVKLENRLYWSREQIDKAIDQLFGDYEIAPYDWRRDSPLYADDPRYHPELRKGK